MGQHDGRGVVMHRPRPPDRSGTVERDGVEIAFDIHDADRPTVVLLPTWSLVDSRVWKFQVPYLARHFRVVTFDGRGSGRSGRPVGAAAYADSEYAADAVAVLDATGTDRAVLVGFSCGAAWSVHVAARHPDRVSGIVAISPACGLSIASPAREKYAFDARLDTTRGWAKYNEHYWRSAGYDDFVRFFSEQTFHEPHSTKQVEDFVGWGGNVSGDTLADTTAGRLGLHGADATPLEPLCAEVTCPVLVVHGTEDHVRPAAIGRRLADLTGGDLVLLDGVGHGPPGREPVRLNHLVKEFADMVHPSSSSRTWVRAQRRPKRALYLSSPIGLGHARRDLAIAVELRERHPDLQVDWLAQDPVTRLLAAAGETVHPASRFLANESAHIEDECAEHDLHAFQAIRRMDEILVNNFMVFNEVVEETHYDLVIGDEAWDVDYFLHENPELKRFAFAWMTDFVGWLPMPSGGAGGGCTHRRLQRRDDRAACPLRPPARPVDLRRQPRRRRGRVLRTWSARHPRVDQRELRLRRLRLGFHPARRGGVRPAARLPRLQRGRPGLPGHRRWLRGRGQPAPQGPGRRTPRPPARARAEVPAGVRSPDRSGITAATAGGEGARLPARPLPPPCGLRPRRGPGRTHDLHGAHRQPTPVPLRAVAEPLRAELPRPAPAGEVRRRPVRHLRGRLGSCPPGRDDRQDRAPGGALPARRDRWRGASGGPAGRS